MTSSNASGTRVAGEAADPAANPPGEPLRLENQLCFSLVSAGRSAVAFYRPFLEPIGLTHPQYLVMLALWQYGELSVRRLSELLMLEPATVSPLLKRLESGGLLTRERMAGDERQLRVSLTPAGEALRSEAELIPAAIAERMGLGRTDFAELRRILDRFLAAMTARA